jgi:carbohydrate-selective porin OprB
VFGVAVAVDGLSGPHRAYLAAGGHGFLLGDGALSYGLETIGEAYYRAQLGPHIAVSPDAMLIVNPGYNRVRGPAMVFTLRVRATN